LNSNIVSKVDPSDLPTDRKFGLFISFVFLVIFLFFKFSNEGDVSSMWLMAPAITVIISLVQPVLFHWPNRVWAIIGLLLGKVMSPIALGIIFFGLICPTSIISRTLGRDFLKLKIDHEDLVSGWVVREVPEINFKDQH